jgi:uncharacterized membrane protein YoaK (UPF0700 family)
MFRHKGKKRTYSHNLRLASVLSLIAGMVNITGVLGVNALTTNVTGHFAFFAEELSLKNYSPAIIFLVYIFAFLLGAFVSNLLVEAVSRIRPRLSHAIPMIIEILILGTIGIFVEVSARSGFNTHLVACSMLFAMGLQNSLVTKVSDSVVRTTHLTGLFTDLGIELSQIFFFKKNAEREKLRKSINLRLAIIACFFIGCISGGVLFKILTMKTLFIASIILLLALFYDNLRYELFRFYRRFRS